VTIKLFGIPEAFATSLGLATAQHSKLAHVASLSLDKRAFPRGASWPFFLTTPRFLPSFAPLTFYPSVSALSVVMCPVPHGFYPPDEE
jgi:hypothetical protein